MANVESETPEPGMHIESDISQDQKTEEQTEEQSTSKQPDVEPDISQDKPTEEQSADKQPDVKPEISARLEKILADCPKSDNSHDNLLVAKKIALMCADEPEDIMVLVVYPALKEHFHFRNKTCDEIKGYVEQAKAEKIKEEQERTRKEAEINAAREALLQEYAEHGEPGKSVIVSVNKEFENVSKKVSLCFTFDNVEGFKSERCATELLIDGESVACVKSNFDITHEESKQAIKELQSHISEALSINNSESNDLVNELMELTNTNREKILCLSKAYVAQQEAIRRSEQLKEKIQKIQQADKYASLDGLERPLYFGCIVPNDYRITPHGVDLKVVKWDKIEKEHVTVWNNISSIRIMITGRFQSSESTEIVELTYIDNGVLNRIYTPLGSVLGIKEFKETLRPKNVRLDDLEIRDMIKFFNKCITANSPTSGSEFKHGWCYNTTGWKNAECTKFIAGSRMFEDINGTLQESECIYTREERAHVFDPRGSIEGWVTAVSPLMQYDKVRFVSYAAFAATLLKILNVDSFTIDIWGGVPGNINDKAGSGKTTMAIIAMSGFGNVNDRDTDVTTLYNECKGTPNFIENLTAEYTDTPILLDESTHLRDDIREELAYRISSGRTKGRARDGNGNNQETKRKQTVAIVTGERPLVPDNSNVGARVRTPQIVNGIGVSGIGDVVSAAKLGSIENSGHLLKLFLSALFANREKLKTWLNEAKKQLIESTDNDISKRQADYFAVITVAGTLLESVYENIGMEKKCALDVVKNIWNNSILMNEITGQWLDALRDTWDWFCVHEQKNFGDTTISSSSTVEYVDEIGSKQQRTTTYERENTNEIWGWRGISDESHDVVNIIPAKLSEFLKDHGYDSRSTLESWRVQGLLNTSAAKLRVDGTPGKVPTDITASHYGKKYRVVQLKKKDVEEKLGVVATADESW